MTRCKRISTPSLSAARFAPVSGRTLKPIIIPLEALAKVTSDSFIAPTAVCIIRTLTPSTSIFINDAASASTEPWTSPLMMTLRSFISPCFICSNKLSNETLLLSWRCCITLASWRASPIRLACFSSLNTTNLSPACGTSLIPVISTGVEGPAVLIRWPKSLTIARILPYVLPTTSESPTLSVPFWTNNEADGPRDLSNSASITVPTAFFSGLAFNSCTSEVNTIISNKSSIPSPLNAESGTKIVSPPQSSGIKPYSVNSCITRSGFEVGLSILFTATIVGTSASLAWFIASIVWGITPSSAATTKIVISVTWAPRARIVVKAAWPGVSRKVIFLPSFSIW